MAGRAHVQLAHSPQHPLPNATHPPTPLYMTSVILQGLYKTTSKLAVDAAQQS